MITPFKKRCVMSGKAENHLNTLYEYFAFCQVNAEGLTIADESSGITAILVLLN